MEEGYQAAENIAEGIFDETSEETTAEEVVVDSEDGEEVQETEKKALTPSEKKKYKIKVDQEEMELELSDEELIKELQKSRSADQRYKIAAEQRKQTEGLLEALKHNPVEVLKRIGWDDKKIFDLIGDNVIDLAEEKLAAKYQREMLSKEERRLLELEEENNRLKQTEEERAAIQERIEYRSQVEAQKEHYTRSINSAIEEAGLENTPELSGEVKRIAAAYIKQNRDATWGEIINLANSRIEQQRNRLLSNISVDKLAELIGQEKLDAIRNKKIEEFKNGTIKKTAKAVESKEVKRRPNKTLRMQDLNEQLFALTQGT